MTTILIILLTVSVVLNCISLVLLIRTNNTNNKNSKILLERLTDLTKRVMYARVLEEANRLLRKHAIEEDEYLNLMKDWDIYSHFEEVGNERTIIAKIINKYNKQTKEWFLC